MRSSLKCICSFGVSVWASLCCRCYPTSISLVRTQFLIERQTIHCIAMLATHLADILYLLPKTYRVWIWESRISPLINKYKWLTMPGGLLSHTGFPLFATIWMSLLLFNISWTLSKRSYLRYGSMAWLVSTTNSILVRYLLN